MTRTYKTKDGKEIQILVDHVTTKSGNFTGVCASAVLSYLGCEPGTYKFAWNPKTGGQKEKDILRRAGYNVRSRKSAFKTAKTMGVLRKQISEYSDYTNDVVYLVTVPGHILLLGSDGNTLVDTAPRKKDRRRIIGVTAVFN